MAESTTATQVPQSPTSAGVRASVVIPVLNGEVFLPACLEALAAQTGGSHEVIAVDNGSTDGSLAVLANYPSVRVVRFPRNRGFAAACNAGADVASGDAVIFLNQDTRVASDWLAAMLAPLADPEVGVVGCKLLYGDGQRVQHAGGYLQLPNWYGRHYGSGEVDHGQWDEPRQVLFVTGAAMALRRRTFIDHGGFDEGFFPAYFEDADLCLRLRQAGLKALYWPSARALHFESASRDLIDMSLAYNLSRLRLVLKHCEMGDAFASFATTERDELLPIAGAGGCQRLAQAYLAAMTMAPPLLQARGATSGQVSDVVQTFKQLYLDMVAIDQVMLLRGVLYPTPPIPDLAAMREGGEQRLGLLQEFRFDSRWPLVARLREACFGVAGRWAVRHLTQQQNLRNLRYDEALVRLIDLRQTDALLAERLAAIEARLDGDERGGGHGG